MKKSGKYILPKKKNVRNHFILVGIAVSLLAALTAVTERLGLFYKN